MNEWSDRTLSVVVQDLCDSQLYHDVMVTMQELVNNKKVKADDLQRLMNVEFQKAGFKQRIRNHVYQYIIKNPSLRETVPQPKEPLDFLKKAQSVWERRVFKSLNSMCSELGIALAKKRPISEQRDLEAKWSELSTEDIDLSRIRPVYSPKDFLDVLLNVRSYNLSSSSGEAGSCSIWGQIKVPLKVKDLNEMRRTYEELTGNVTHVGFEDFGSLDINNAFVKERLDIGAKVLSSNDAPLAREYAKRGCEPAIRFSIWLLILGIENNHLDLLKFHHLKSCVLQHDFMIDKLIVKDIRLTSSNDDQYFVFEDLLYQVLLVFTRDVSILDHFERSSASPATAYIKGRLNQEAAKVFYPPNGVIPFHGFSMYVTPLCYLTEDPVPLYGIFKEFYCRYFFRLHALSSHSQGILSLCLLLEILLQEVDPQLTYHFANYDIQPLKVAVKWIMRAYSGYLSVDQVLSLWDRILAYDSLELLSVLAVGILVFRKPFLLQAENQTTSETMLSDISTVKVIPLMQLILRNS